MSTERGARARQATLGSRGRGVEDLLRRRPGQQVKRPDGEGGRESSRRIAACSDASIPSQLLTMTADTEAMTAQATRVTKLL